MRNTNKYHKYIKEVCNIVKTDSLFRNEISKTKVLNKIENSGKVLHSYEGCHKVVFEIIEELRKLGDLHSKFKVYDPTLTKNYEDEDENDKPEVKVIGKSGYIKLTSFDGTDENEILEYSQDLQNRIKEITEQGIKGYIVDLRYNAGGNMDPMILGLGPLIERNPTAYFSFPDGSKHSWGYLKGSYYYNDEVYFTLPKPFLIKKRLPIAVIIGPRTASSAEMLTVSLLKDGVKLFGETTKNRTTGNAVYKLEDRSKLVLSTCKLTDLNGNDYLTGIHPDTITNEKEDIERAIEWIKYKLYTKVR